MQNLGANFAGYMLLFLLLGVPIVLTVFNIAFLLFDKRISKRTKAIIDIEIFVLGILFTAFLAWVMGFSEWNESIYVGEWYTPVSFTALPTFIVLCVVAIVSYILPRIFSTALPPIIASLCYAGMFLGFVLTAVWGVQLSKNITDIFVIYLLLFPFNYLLCCIRLIRSTVREYSRAFGRIEYTHPVLKVCGRILGKAAGFVLVSFVLAIPLLLVVILILLLFGQKPDAVITAFTDTAEWTLSQQIPPPRLDYQGHYLCTVAACGDEKIVKPLRAGRRRGRLIVVNRQLLIANAFEDLIAQRTPRFHRWVRRVYDRCGLPLSRYITTKRRSNVVYVLMKPLEWLFLMVLYTFDAKPENRIAMQYIG